MALSEEVNLQIERALAQLKRLDRSLKDSLSTEVRLDVKLAQEKIKALRKEASTSLGRKIELTLSTTAATAALDKYKAKVESLRKLTEKSMTLGFNRQSLSANERAIDRMTASIDEYRTSVGGAARNANLFTRALTRQVVEAGLLNKELKEVVASTEALSLATSRVRPPQLGPGRAELRQIIKEQEDFEKNIGRASSGDLLGPITTKRIEGIKAEQAAATTAAKERAKVEGDAAKASQRAAAEEERTRRKAAQGLRVLNSESQSLNQQLIATGRSMTLLFTLPTLLVAAFAAFKEFQFDQTIQRTKVLTDAFTKFDATGRKVNLTAAETTTRMGALRDVFNNIASQTGQTPQDIAEGFYFVASAGGVAATRLSILRVASQGAAIGLGSVEVVADALTSVLNAYGESVITAAQAGDILVRSVNDAKVEAADFAPQLGRVLPLAAQLGIGFGQVAESLALLTQTGNDAGTAATQLRGILQTLVRPTSLKAAEILKSVGLDTQQLRDLVAQDSPTAFIDTLLKLKAALPIEEFAQLFRRVDALNGALTLTNNEDAIASFREMDKAAHSTATSLAEFERFATNNRSLQIKQSFAQLLAQLQPLGQKVLPLVAAGLGSIVGLIDDLAELLKVPILGPAVLGVGALVAAAGPLIFSLGKIRQGLQALTKVSTVLNTPGGFGQFLKGAKVEDIAAGADAATARTTRLGQAFKALPGVIGVAAAAGLAFFSGKSLASDDTKTRILGIVEALAAVGLAFVAARSAAAAFGVTSSFALGAIGTVAAVLAGGFAIWTAYKEAVNKSRKALDEFKGSLVGLTANEALKNFGVALTKSLKGITADDRVTKIEIPALNKALDDLGLSYDDLGQKLLNIVLLNPDDLEAQRLAIRGLAEEISKPLATNSIDSLTTALDRINKRDRGKDLLQLPNNELLNADSAKQIGTSLRAIGQSTDELNESMVTLASKGLLEVRGGILQIPVGKLDEAKAALVAALGPDAANLLDNTADALRRTRENALQTTGEFVLATNAAGSFKTVMEDGVATDVFVADVDNAVSTLDALSKALDNVVSAVFGVRDNVTQASLVDTLTETARKRAAELAQLTSPTDENFINFKVSLTGPQGLDARQYIRDQIDEIDNAIQPFLSGPDANIDVALRIRDQQVAILAGQIGTTVDDLNAFLASDRGGTTTAQIRVGLDEQSTQDTIDQVAKLRALIASSPLTADIKLKVEQDTTGDLFGSELLSAGLRKGGRVVVDFVLNAEAKGASIDQLQSIFAGAPQDTVRNILFSAIDQGASVKDLSGLLAAIPPTIRTGLKVSLPSFEGVGSDISDIDKQHLLFDAKQEKQILINMAVDGADAFTDVASITADLTAQAQNSLNAGGGISIPVDTSALADVASEFTGATNAAGSFVSVIDESGASVIEFQSNVKDTADTVAGLTDKINKAIEAVFGLRDSTFTGEAKDNLGDLVVARGKALKDQGSPVNLDANGNPVLIDQFGKVVPTNAAGVPKKDTSKGHTRGPLTQQANENFINFTVGFQGEDGRDARQFVRAQIADIDKIIQPLLTGPDADINLGLGLRDDAIAKLAFQIGVDVPTLNAFLAGDQGGLTTVQIQTRLEELHASDLQATLTRMQTLLNTSPLTADVKASIVLDQTGALFGSELLNKGLTDGRVVVDFVVNAIETGIPLTDLQTIFGPAATTDVVRNVLVTAIDQGESVANLAKFIATLSEPIRTELHVDIPQFSGNGLTGADFDKAQFLFNKKFEAQFTINAALTGAAEFVTLQTSVEAGSTYPVVTQVDDAAVTDVVNTIAANGDWNILVNLDDTQLNVFLARLGLGLAQLNHANSGTSFSRQAAGGIWSGSGFRQFKAGGMAAGVVNGFGMPRVPMLGAAPSNMRGILWGEPGTHKEAYVPYNPARRVRAKALVSRVAKDFGMRVEDGPRQVVSSRGAVIDSERSMSASQGREIIRLAGEVATLAKVIEEREVQPLIGEYHAETATSNPRATARYLATDLVKALNR